MVEDLLLEFSIKFDQYREIYPIIPPKDIRTLRRKLISEEVGELIESFGECDIEHIAKELADVIYVCYGTALAYGIPLDKVVAEVHKGNMSKIWEDGVIHKDSFGKIIKPDDYVEPDIWGVLFGYAPDS